MNWIIENIDIFLSFIIYSFIGWIIESTFKTIKKKSGFINSGFLHNPFIPMYGFGAIFIILIDKYIEMLFFPVKIIIFALVCTIFEYLTGLFFEKLFKIKLWDYSNKMFNIHGRICLVQTVLWMLLIIVFLVFIKPIVDSLILAKLLTEHKFYITLILLSVILVDTIISTLELKNTANLMNNLFAKFKIYSVNNIERLSYKIKNRFFKIFPNLEKIFNTKMHKSLLNVIKSKVEKSNIKKAIQIIINPTEKTENMDPLYLQAVKDLLDHESVQKMSEFSHHDNTTLFHSFTVSQISYYLAKEFKYDEKSTARGALLHDLYLYNWRDGTEKHHATKHSKIALENAKKVFKLNEIEEDIIIKHMWPLTRKFFKYKESFLVSVVDKMVSTKEVVNMMNNLINTKINKS